MYADKDVVASDRGHQRRKIPGLPISGTVVVVRLFGSSHSRAFGATTPGQMNSRIRLRSDVAATLLPFSFFVHHNRSILR